MSITLSVDSQKVIPAITLNRLHIESFVLKQSIPRKLSVSAVGRRYGNSGDETIYDDKVVEAVSVDLDTDVATYSCTKRSITSKQFLIDYTAALVQVSVDFNAGTLTEAQIMAYMELGMALIFDIKNKFNIDGTGA